MRGSSRYLIGSAETDNPIRVAAASEDRFPQPAAKTVDFAMLIVRPEVRAKSSNTLRVPSSDAGEPSVKTTMSSAKLKHFIYSLLVNIIWDISFIYILGQKNILLIFENIYFL